MIQIIYILLVAIVGFIIADIITLRKVRKEKSQLEVLRDWCSNTGLNPNDYIKSLKECSKMIREVNKNDSK